MTLILFLIFAVAIFGVMLILSFIKGLSSFIFRSSYIKNDKYASDPYGKDEAFNHSVSKPQKKVFSRNEGEYVSYEEMKE